MLLSDVAFQSTLPARGATSRRQSRQSRQQFQSTLPARGATRTATHKRRRERFQSTLPARGATLVLLTLDKRRKFQSTLPARGATTDGDAQAPPRKISIHAPRTGSDKPEKPPAATSRRNFNPRSPHGERHLRRMLSFWTARFQSTLPARGATWCNPPYGRRIGISIHAPRTGSDPGVCEAACGKARFQSTLPARGATERSKDIMDSAFISIHAPRTGSDGVGLQKLLCVSISIHAPRTGSDCSGSAYFWISASFQSTLPARGATI